MPPLRGARCPLFTPTCEDFLVSISAIDANGAALVVSKITIIRAVVALDIIFAILESLLPAFAIAGVVIVKDDIVSVLSVHNY